MMRIAIFLVPAVMLSACDPAPVAENTVAAAPVAPAGPAFTATKDQASALVKGLGGPWASGVVKDGLRDPKTGGTVTTMTSADASAQIFAWPGGQVWQVRVISGGANGCGDIVAIRAAIAKLVDGLSPASKMTAGQRTAISDDLNDPKTADHAIAGAKVSVTGGCRMWLTVTAA